MKNLLALLFMVALAYSAKGQVVYSGGAPSNALVAKYRDTYYYYYSARDTNGLYYFYYQRFQDYGKERLTPSIFEETGSFSNQMAIAKLNGKYGYVDTSGKVVIPCIYDDAQQFSDDIAVVFVDCKMGLITKAGKLTMITKNYEHIYPFVESRATVVANKKYGVIDKNGNEIVPPTYRYVNYYHKGFAVVTDFDKGINGLIDSMGAVVYAPAYDDFEYQLKRGLFQFSNTVHDGIDFIILRGIGNAKGKVYLKPEYNSVAAVYQPDSTLGEPFLIVGYKFKKVESENRFYRQTKLERRKEKRRIKRHPEVAKVGLDKELDNLTFNILLDNNGKVLYADSNSVIGILDYKHAYAVNKTEFKLINVDGTVTPMPGMALDARKERINVTAQAALVTTASKQFGLIDFDGNFIIKPEYDSINIHGKRVNYQLSYTYHAYKKDSILIYSDDFKPVHKLNASWAGLYYVYNDTVHAIRSYSKLRPEIWFSILWRNGKCVISDTNYKAILPVVYDTLWVGYNRIAFYRNGAYGLMNSDFKEINYPLPFRIVIHSNEPDENNLFQIELNGKRGLCDKNGTVIIQPLYDSILPESNTDTYKPTTRYYTVNIGKKQGLLTSFGKMVIPIQYAQVDISNNYIIVSKGKKQGLFTMDGNQIISIEYTNIDVEEINLKENNTVVTIIAERNGKYGALDSTGKVLLPVKYGYVDSFKSGKFFFVDKGKKTGVVTRDNKTVLPIKYDFLNNWNAYDAYQAGFKNKSGLIDRAGKIIIPFEYTFIKQWDDDILTITKGKRDNLRWGVANTSGKIIVPAIYNEDQITYNRNTIILTVGDNRYFYNSNGEPVVYCYIDKY